MGMQKSGLAFSTKGGNVLYRFRSTEPKGGTHFDQVIQMKDIYQGGEGQV